MSEEALLLWSQAGERPYEVLKEQELFESFMKYLIGCSYLIKNYLYRGTRRHSELKIGEILNYTYPTSWTTRFENATNFVQEIGSPVIISLSSKETLRGLENYKNTYGEYEVILYPLILKVVNKYHKGKFIVLQVIPA